MSEIAEKFDVNYTLDCSSDGEKSSYNYICRQQHKLPKKGEEIRQAINNSSSLDDLLKIDNSLQRITYSGELDNHQFFVLKQIAGKKYRELNREAEKENQEEVRRNRSR
ncbi:hypothetical protein [Sphingobacterium faecium]|uniref:hypothetical protein n=1 Tax=Sphingobacterium faecium TaxID=34087 RepID=UPI0032089191